MGFGSGSESSMGTIKSCACMYAGCMPGREAHTQTPRVHLRLNWYICAHTLPSFRQSIRGAPAEYT